MATAALDDARAPLRAIRLGSACHFQLDCCDLLQSRFLFSSVFPSVSPSFPTIQLSRNWFG